MSPLNLADREPVAEENSVESMKTEWSQKSIHGRYYHSLHQPDADLTASVTYLSAGYLYAETEGSIHAIQDQMVPTRMHRKYIHKEVLATTKCRLCNAEEESVQHLISACTFLAPTAYLSRHNNVAKVIHQELCLKWGLTNVRTPHYKYEPDPVKENYQAKIYWDQTIVTDRAVQHNRPDIMFLDKQLKKVWLLDISVPLDDNIGKAYREKVSKYELLCQEIKAVWQVPHIKTIPIIISANGIVHKKVKAHLKEEFDLSNNIILWMQKSVLLGTASIIRRSLSK